MTPGLSGGTVITALLPSGPARAIATIGYVRSTTSQAELAERPLGQPELLHLP